MRFVLAQAGASTNRITVFQGIWGNKKTRRSLIRFFNSLENRCGIFGSGQSFQVTDKVHRAISPNKNAATFWISLFGSEFLHFPISG